MKSTPMLFTLVLASLALAAEPTTTKTEKTVTYIAAETSADGGSEIAHEKMMDCIVALPNPDKMQAQVSSQSVYVQGVNGEAGRNEWIKSYIARLDVSYLTREKELIIVTTRNINGQPPVLREIEKTLKHTQTFISNSTEGEVFAGRSDRQYYFTKAESAIRDVKERAKIWVSQQEAVVCPAK